MGMINGMTGYLMIEMVTFSGELSRYEWLLHGYLMGYQEGLMGY